MRYAWLTVALVSGGCNALLGIEDLTIVTDGGTSDGAGDGAAETCYGTLISACFTPPGPSDVALGSTFDTTTDPRCRTVSQPNGPDVCALHASSFSIATGGLVVTGGRPLMLVATGAIVVANPIEVGSEATRAGPGANPANPACLTPMAGTDGGNDGAGGGAGGSFGTVGAAGGTGSDTGGAGANPTGAPQPIAGLRGGCLGSAGGRANGGNANDAGAAGNGGGALYLFAGTSISITARVNASGAGGRPATDNHAGGGGGGSGGMIALEATAISIDGPGGEVFANGGGGGEGTRDTAATRGLESTAWDVAGSGGTGGSGEGGDGGGGAIEGTPATVGQNGTGGNNNEGGGGGGGGGLGVIKLKIPPTGANAGRISPAYLPF